MASTEVSTDTAPDTSPASAPAEASELSPDHAVEVDHTTESLSSGAGLREVATLHAGGASPSVGNGALVLNPSTPQTAAATTPLPGVHAKQGTVNDCHVIADVYSLSTTESGNQLLDNMVKPAGKHSYQVTFPNGDAATVTDKDMKHPGLAESPSFVRTIEVANAKVQQQHARESGSAAPDWFAYADAGSFGSITLERMTGHKTSDLSPQYVPAARREEYIADVARGLKANQGHLAVTGEMVNESTLEANGIKTTTRPDGLVLLPSGLPYVPYHMHSIIGVNEEKRTFTVVNPWNTDRHFDVPFGEMAGAFKHVTYAPVDSSADPQTLPVNEYRWMGQRDIKPYFAVGR